MSYVRIGLFGQLLRTRELSQLRLRGCPWRSCAVLSKQEGYQRPQRCSLGSGLRPCLLFLPVSLVCCAWVYLCVLDILTTGGSSSAYDAYCERCLRDVQALVTNKCLSGNCLLVWLVRTLCLCTECFLANTAMSSIPALMCNPAHLYLPYPRASLSPPPPVSDSLMLRCDVI